MGFSPGLEGVIADKTAISNVEGDIGRLSYRGYPIEFLVRQDYESVLWLVLFGEMPSPAERERLVRFLAEHGPLDDHELALLQRIDHDRHPMRVLQAMIPLLSAGDVRFEGLSDEGAHGLRIIARLPTLIAAWRGITTRGSVPSFDGSASCLENFLTMFNGETPNAEALDVLKTVQILQMEHSFNAGTFTARVAASTLAPVDAVCSAAVGALFGRLHGGADEAALLDAKAVGSPEGAEAFVDDLLARKGRLMGMGHREYRKVDPRAVILKPLAAKLCAGTEHQNVFDTLCQIEAVFNARMAEKGKEVWANLEFYKGPVYEALGIPANYFTAVFAMSRAVGWLAHFVESRVDNRIMRPKAEYVGPGPREI